MDVHRHIEPRGLSAHELRDLNEIAAGVVPHGGPGGGHVRRAYISVHLAALAEVAREAGVRDTRFSSFDEALNRAARSLGRTLIRAR